MADRNGDVRNNNRHLFRLSELDDYKVASDDPDVRGWEIVDRDKEEFGTVRDLIVDPDLKKVRYLEVELSDELSPGRIDARLLVPIGVAKLDEDNNTVIVNEVDRVHIASFPLYTGGVVDRDYEAAVMERFSNPPGTTPTTGATEDFYNTPMYDEDLFYTNRNGRDRT